MFISNDRMNINFDKLEGYLSGYLVIENGSVYIQTPTLVKQQWELVPIKNSVEVITMEGWQTINIEECKLRTIHGGFLYAGLRARTKEYQEEK